MEQSQNSKQIVNEEQNLLLWSNDSDMISCYGNMVYRLAYARLQNRHDADDIFQEVYLRYVRRAPVFESYEHGKAWFLRTTINCCKNLWMSAWHRKTTALTVVEEQPVYYENEEAQMLAEQNGWQNTMLTAKQIGIRAVNGTLKAEQGLESLAAFECPVGISAGDICRAFR